MKSELNSALRFGHVAEFDPKLYAAKVSFPDRGIVSHWLPVLTRSTSLFQDECPLSPGEHVACLMAGNGYESGVVLGTIFDRKNTPPIHEAKTRGITFSDWTKITYDAESHKLEIKIDADVELKINGKTSREYVGDIEEKITGNTDREIIGDIETRHDGTSKTITEWPH